MLRRLIYILLVVLICFLCSCSNSDPEPELQEDQETQKVTKEVQAVYTYNETKILDQEITLKLGAEPLPFQDGYVRLVGVVGGVEKIACIEISGRGQVFSIGDKLDNYEIVLIGGEEVLLCLKK